MSNHATSRANLADPVSHLLSLGLTQLSIQVAMSTSLTASALGLAALATALTSTILTVQEAFVPHWQWALLPSIAAIFVGLLATASAGAVHIGAEDVFAVYEEASSCPQDVGVTVLRIVRKVSLENDRALRLKDRLTEIALVWLVLGMLLIGALSLVGATLS